MDDLLFEITAKAVKMMLAEGVKLSVGGLRKMLENQGLEFSTAEMEKMLEAGGHKPVPTSPISNFPQRSWQNRCKSGDKSSPSLTLPVDIIKGPDRYPISFKEAEDQAKRYSARIFSAWPKLRNILQHRESVLRKRWAKKSIEQRKVILLKAWPDMPVQHRPDLQQISKRQTTPTITNAAEGAFKWPHISLEDLTPVDSLLLLLNARGRNHPNVFAHFDLNACGVGVLSGNVRIADLDEYVMVIVGQETEEDFGKFVSLKTDYKPFLLFLAGVNFEPGMGLLALEIQSRILEFLVECCYRIFHDIPKEELCSHVEPATPEPGAIISASSTSYLQLSAMVAEAPFKAPAKLDTHRLLVLLETKRAAAEDHLWEMREDPGYFQSILMECGDHRCERVLDACGKFYRHHDDEIFWNNVIDTTLGCGYVEFLLWSKLGQLARELDAKARRALDTLDHQKPLPKEIEKIILELMSFARDFARHMLSKLSVGLASSSHATGLRLVRITEHSAMGKPCHQVKVQAPKSEDQLMKLFCLLSGGDMTFLTMYGLDNVLNELQRLIDANPSQKKRLTSYVSRAFSDLALLCNVTTQLSNFFPWASSFERKLANLGKPSDTCTMDIEDVSQAFCDKDRDNDGGTETSRLELPIATALFYPIHKAPNEANVKAIRQAESNLDAFWERIDDLYLRTIGQSLFQLLGKYAISPRELRRTPEWVPPKQSVGEHPESMLEGGLQFKNLKHTPEKPGRLRGQIWLTKVKTRGYPDTLEKTAKTPTQSMTASDSKLNKQQQFCIPKLSRRAVKVFCTLLPTLDGNKYQHEIAWNDFLHSMTSIGFAAEKLYGSVWHFTPKAFQSERSIHVHEPHPSGKISFHNARRLGRRLARNYGWTGEMFASKE
jgi:hypothetical protein